jgi:hypothetical protein
VIVWANRSARQILSIGGRKYHARLPRKYNR